MSIALTALAGLLGYWLGWYYGAGLGYTIWPNSEWMGALATYLVGAPLCASADISITWKMLSRRRK